MTSRFTRWDMLVTRKSSHRNLEILGIFVKSFGYFGWLLSWAGMQPTFWERTSPLASALYQKRSRSVPLRWIVRLPKPSDNAWVKITISTSCLRPIWQHQQQRHCHVSSVASLAPGIKMQSFPPAPLLTVGVNLRGHCWGNLPGHSWKIHLKNTTINQLHPALSPNWRSLRYTLFQRSRINHQCLGN